MDGPRVLVEGPLAEGLVSDVAAAGGNLSAADLASYKAIVREPVRTNVFGLEFVSAPPPSSGGATVLQALTFLAGYLEPFAGAGLVRYHRLVEAMKHAFALRMSLGDPAFVGDVDGVVADAVSPEFNARLREATSDDAVAPAAAYGGPRSTLTPLPEDHGTSHFSVVDADRNAVALTTTINTLFGSKVISPSTGVLLNNEMDDFSSPTHANAYDLPPSPANFVRPKKRPLSSMSPTIAARNGRVAAVVGASGGSRIITATLQTLTRLVLEGHTPVVAVSAPRLHSQLIPNHVLAEDWEDITGGAYHVPADLIDALHRRGHWVNASSTHAVVQLVACDADTDELVAVSDHRKGGRPAAM